MFFNNLCIRQDDLKLIVNRIFNKFCSCPAIAESVSECFKSIDKTPT